MKKLLIALFLVVSVLAINAKETDTKAKSADGEVQATMILNGTVADEISRESLVGVEVKLEGTDLVTYTDFDGNFSFNKVKPGEYKLVTNYISYKKKSELLKVSAKENEVKIKLHSSN